ncbi:hypothetical protein PVAP13_2NG087100 [Panicum virgatum]|uniref:CCHC-type domain-containing protein n=1 Tax=Panicum virgatum TaxID=38727 RepID=A0A8T0VB14_PANVG|nr:hypothetical protein PVAP13_2NG087100 [Panicum virgatum]
MSTSYEVSIELLVSDASNYAFWSIHVHKHLRKLGPLAERVVVAIILPPNFRWKNVDITNQKEIDCMQFNVLVTDYLLSIVCAEISDIILEDEEIRENNYLIWKFLKNLYSKNCSVSSVARTAHQESSVKSHEDKNSKGIDSTPEITANPEVPDSEPGSSRFRIDTENCQSDDESASTCFAQSHYGHHQCFMVTTEEKSDSDSENDSDSDRRETILKMMKKVMRQDQEMKRQKKLLNKKDDEIKCLALVEERNHALKAELDELTSKHTYLQNMHQKLKCSNDKLVDSFVGLEVAREVIVTVVKSYKQIDNACSQNDNKEKQSWYEQVIVEDYNDDLALENELLKQEVERLSKDLIKLKGKSVVQPSQNNRETMVKKLEKGSIVQNSCNLVYKSREVKPQTKKRNLAHVKCFKCSNIGHYASLCSIKIESQQNLSKRQRSLPKRRCFGCCKMGHRIATCPDKLSKPESFGMSEPKVLALKSQRHFRPNKGFKKAQEKYLEKKAQKICYTCRGKGHFGKDCPNGNSPKPNLINNVSLCVRRLSKGVGAGRMISSSTTRPRAIWVPKSLLTNLRGPNVAWVPKCA